MLQLYCNIANEPIFDSKLFGLEDPFIWQNDTGEYQMIAKDMNGDTCGEPRGGVYASSSNGVDWTLHKGELAYSRKILWDDGIVREMGNLDRPFILIENGKPTHIFFATCDGKSGLGDCENTWNMVIPLK